MRDLIGTAPGSLSHRARWTLLGLRTALAALFIYVAARNLAGDAGIAANFERWGCPDWLRILAAVVQGVGGMLLLLPASAPFGASLLALTLLGAVGIHLLRDSPPHVLAPLILLAAVLTVMVLYRPPLLR